MVGILIGGMMVALITGMVAGMEIQQLRQEEQKEDANRWN